MNKRFKEQQLNPKDYSKTETIALGVRAYFEGFFGGALLAIAARIGRKIFAVKALKPIGVILPGALGVHCIVKSFKDMRKCTKKIVEE